MTQFSDERGAELRQLFFETSQELLQALNDDALKLEKNPDDPETVRGIRRTVHTLKGDAAACGFRELSELAHELEDALAMEHSSAPVSMAEIAFTAADAFEAILVSYRGNLAPPSPEPLRKMIRALTDEADILLAAGEHKNTLRAENSHRLDRSRATAHPQRAQPGPSRVSGCRLTRSAVRHADCGAPARNECPCGNRPGTGCPP